jgi:hypothetical protein
MTMCAAISKVSAKGAECGRSFSTAGLIYWWWFMALSRIIAQVFAKGVRRPYTSWARYHRS